MELRDLKYFAVIARHRSLSRAADTLEISAAALSKSLRRLEASVDAKLVERAAKGVALTSFGKLLLARIDKLRLSFEDVKREALEMGAGRAGELRIGMNQVDVERITAVCMRLHAEAPALSFDLVVSTNDEMLPRLLGGDLDVVVSLQPPSPYPGTIREPLLEDEMVVCASPNHPLSRRRRLTVADLAGQRWVLNAGDVQSRRALEDGFRRAGFPGPTILVQSRALQARATALAHSHALGYQSRRLLKLFGSGAYRFVELPVKELACPVSLGVMYRKDGYLPRSARRFIDLLQADF